VVLLGEEVGERYAMGPVEAGEVTNLPEKEAMA